MRKLIKYMLVFCLCFSVIACNKVTQSKYDQVKQGMSMKQVISILGEPTTSESINIAGIAGTSATWKDRDAEIDIQFLNDQVTIKAFSKAGESKSSETVKDQPNTM